MFHILIVLSDVPPPVISRLRCHGHQDKAFTAPLWPCKLYLGLPMFKSHIIAKSSLLPDANPHASCFNPHTYPRWPCNFIATLWWALVSCPNINESLDPVYRSPYVNADDETLWECPFIVRSNVSVSISYIWVFPLLRPTERYEPWGWKFREHT